MNYIYLGSYIEVGIQYTKIKAESRPIYCKNNNCSSFMKDCFVTQQSKFCHECGKELRSIFIEYNENKNNLNEILSKFNNRLIDVQQFIDCGLPSILIPDIKWNKNLYKIEGDKERLWDLTDFYNHDDRMEFKNFFKEEINYLTNNFEKVCIKWGLINYIT